MTTSMTPGAGTASASTASQAPTAESDGTNETAGGGIARLDAFDGLFLRAEHLLTMQDYARDVAMAVGAGGGPGVVEGFELELGADALVVKPGLAINARGRPLRSWRDVIISLKPEDLPSPLNDSFWWIEVTSRVWGYGHGAVNGTLCDEPCGGGTTHSLYRAEGIRVSLVPDEEKGLRARGRTRRAWLASKLFAKEQSDAGYWPDGSSLSDRSWVPPSADRDPLEGVRLGILLPDTGQEGAPRELDTWMARRDRGAAPPVRQWQWRLGMRPWDVFVAQLLQFQAELKVRVDAAGITAATLSRIDRLLEGVGRTKEEATQAGRTKQTTADQLDQILRDYRERATESAAEPEPTLQLAALGFAELPPAGYLPCSAKYLADVDEMMHKALGDDVRIRVRPCRHVDVGQAIQEAQHRDRIPLVASAGHLADVDILVPMTDHGTDRADGDWVAFVRGDGRGRDAADAVDVYLLDDTGNELYDADLAALAAGGLPDLDDPKQPRTPVHETLGYPQGGWAIPKDTAYAALFDQIQALVTPPQDGRRRMAVVALVPVTGDLPLGLVRATLLTIPFSHLASMTLPQAEVATSEPRTAIVVLVGPVDAAPRDGQPAGPVDDNPAVPVDDKPAPEEGDGQPGG